jgi:ribosomal-protein-alanine N-acetyltransferase
MFSGDQQLQGGGRRWHASVIEPGFARSKHATQHQILACRGESLCDIYHAHLKVVTIACVFKVRPYGPRDFKRLLAIDQACFPEGIAYPEEEMRYFLERASAITLVGTEEAKVLGFVIADSGRNRRAGGSVGHIITIDVAPSAQGRKLGSQLLSSAEEALRNARCSHVALEVAVDNENALRFYKRHGYSVLKALPRYYRDEIDGLLMGKKL